MKLPRLNFSTAQLLLLTALVALCLALGTAVYQRVRHASRPVATAWSADGKLAAVRFSDGRIRLWSDAGQPAGILNTGQFWTLWTTTPTFAVVDDKHLATTSGDGKIEVWNIERQQIMAKFGGTFATPFWESASISGDGRWVASIRVAAQPGIDIWDVGRGVRAKKLTLFGSPYRLVLSHSGERLAMIEVDGTLRIADIESGRQTAGPIRLRAATFDRHTIALSGDLSMVAIAARESAANGSTPVALVDVTKGPPAVVASVPGDCETLTLSRDGKTLATASSTGEIYLWNAADGKQMGQISLAIDDKFASPLELAPAPAVAMNFSPDGKSLLLATNTAIGIYDVPTLARRANLGVIPSRLGRWFFIPAFIVWAMLWGYAARRRGGSSPVRPQVSPDANSIVEAGEEDAQASRQGDVPRAMIAVWVMMFVGGIFAIVWSMLVLFSDFTCLALTPFPYFGLYVGLRATAAGFSRARSEFNLPGIAVLQICSLLAGDVLNPTLGVANFVLLRRESVKQYRSAATT